MSEGLIARLIAWSGRNPYLVLLLGAALTLWGVHAARNAPLDAIPDLSDVQVVVLTEWMGRGPDLIEDQITTPLTSSLLSAPGVTAVRGQSMYGMSFVYVIFDDATAVSDARARVIEAIGQARARLPADANPTLGPDASGVGWVFQYALVDPSGENDPQELRALQDHTLRYALESVPGVAQVAPIGGFVKEYQVQVDPDRLLAHGVTLDAVVSAVRGANAEVGGRVLELAGHEHVVRGRGYIRDVHDLAVAPVPSSAYLRGSALPGSGGGTSALGAVAGAPSSPAGGGGGGGMAGMAGMGGGSAPSTSGSGSSAPPALLGGGGSVSLREGAWDPSRAGVPVRVGDVADVRIGAAARRGVSDLDGLGNTVGAIVILRHGQNALSVIEAVKARLDTVSLPPGVEVVTVYDRSELIEAAIATLRRTLLEELLVVSAVIVLFLLHLRSAMVPILTLPVAVIAAFIPMSYLGLTANIMSLGGIAVAIGAMVDASILLVENVHKRLERWEAEGRPGERVDAVIAGMQEVGPSAFFALLVITVSFVPIFTLEGTEGRLFGPLAWMKTGSMAFAALLAVTLTPALAVLWVRGRILREDANPLNRLLVWLYAPVVRLVVRLRWPVVAAAAAAVAATVPLALSLGSEFMPPLNEGVILYMPTAPPGISEQEAQEVLTRMDHALKAFPEVDRVFGKMGRAETATDPAPLSMAETLITLKPREQWRPGMTWDKLIAELDVEMQVPGMPNAWWMPIQTRTEMLSTGIRSPLGIKVYGDTLAEVEAGAVAVERVLQGVPGTRSAVAERATGGQFIDVTVNREAASRWGLSAAQVLDTVQTGLGGMPVSEAVEGRARYPISVRFARETRDAPESLARLRVNTPAGVPVPLAELATVSFQSGPDMLRSEGGKLVGYVFVDTGDVPVADYVDVARPLVEASATVPDGVRLEWAGQFQALERAEERLKVVVPITLFAVAFLLWLNTRSLAETAIVLLAVPFSLIGAFVLLWALGYHLSVAVWVGLIALAGLDAETGVVMLLYLTLAHGRAVTDGRMRDRADLEEAIVEGAARRIRPKLMTVLCAMMGLMPVLWSDGTGADVMKRIAAPMVGGLVTSFLLELLVYPAIFAIWKGGGKMRRGAPAAV